uniref:NADH-ubiquinone oxidoreductase chain 4L n=1 Tax=Proasellus coxalis TaxID=63229 RepID=A0A485M9E6_9CRUS|nr:NADH dehydrogenase subunit 4l [Proasellus coxalis]
MTALTMFSVGAVSFVLNKNHLLSALISLEFMVLSLFIYISVFYQLPEGAAVSLAFITISVCEGALGLSVLVLYTRSFGSESLGTTVFNTW